MQDGNVSYLTRFDYNADRYGFQLERLTVGARFNPEVGFVRLPTILQVYPISRAGWWKGVKDGTLPAGVLLSARVRAWPVEAIRKLLEEAGKAS